MGIRAYLLWLVFLGNSYTVPDTSTWNNHRSTPIAIWTPTEFPWGGTEGQALAIHSQWMEAEAGSIAGVSD